MREIFETFPASRPFDLGERLRPRIFSKTGATLRDDPKFALNRCPESILSTVCLFRDSGSGQERPLDFPLTRHELVIRLL